MLQGWYGKIIGAILGFIVGRGFLGAIIGLVLGHQFDVAGTRALGRRNGTGKLPRGDTTVLRRAFFEATFQTMGHVAKSDGRVTELEIDAAREAMRRFSLAEADRLRAIELFTAGKQADFPLEETLANLRQLAGNQPDLYRLFVQIQLEAAIQGNGLGDRPRTVLQRICRVLGVSALEFASLEAMLRMHAGSYSSGPGGRSSSQGAGSAQQSGARLADAYEVLGVPASAPDAAVTKAFRRLMSQNHPDKLVAQGLPESMIAAAHERTQRILEAYDLVKNHRGIK
jgi:DnaJ like chaperone protein